MIGSPSLHVHVDGRQTWLRSHAHEGGVTPPVALLHGWTLSADEQWHSLYPWLAARMSFVAIDHPGHGRSDPPDGPFTLIDAADRAAEVLRSFSDEPVVLVGFSLGGPVALHVATRHPSLVAGLVLVSTTHRLPASRLTRLGLQCTETFLRSRAGDRLRVAEARRLQLPTAIEAARRRLQPHAMTSAALCLDGLDLSSLVAQIAVPAAVVDPACAPAQPRGSTPR
jgi:3-oxoadipate enol-lactonase